MATGEMAALDEQIRRLDVPMHDAELMRVIERLSGLNAELGNAAVKIPRLSFAERR